MWAVKKAELTVKPFLACFATARDWLPSVVKIDDDPRLMTQPGSVLARFLHDLRDAIKKIGVSGACRKSEYVAFFGFVTFWAQRISSSRTKAVMPGFCICGTPPKCVVIQVLSASQARG